MNKINKYILIQVSIAILSGALLSSAFVSAEDAVDEINIIVPVSCTLSGTGTNSHNANITNGTSNSNIGETTLKAFCNDNNGFAIYAIGYTDNEYGKNVLTSSTSGSTHDITTGTATSGGTSNWAMKLSTISSPAPTYPIILAGSSADTQKEQGDPDYSTFQEVPDDYAKVAYRIASTDIGASAEGTTLTTTYQAYISPTQPADTYVGKVKYTLIHPHDSTAPQKPISIEDALAAAGKQKYNGYYKIQDVDSIICEAANVIETDGTVEVIDVRDNTIYKITKLKDNRCWMLDNLALDPTDSTTAASMSVSNTNATSEAISNYLNGGSSTTGWSTVPVANVTSNFRDAAGYIEPRVNNQSKNTLVKGYGLASENNQSKVGMYYNYCAATVGTYCYEGNTLGNNPVYDICPANWRLPTSGSTGEYSFLISKYDSTAEPTDLNSLQYNLSVNYPGYYDSEGTGLPYRNYFGFYVSSSIYNATPRAVLHLDIADWYIEGNGTNYGDRNSGLTVRCLAD